MRPASCKAKGRRLQQVVAADIRAAFALPESDVRSCGMGQNGEDVVLSERARAHVPWSIECKNVERLNVWDAHDHAAAHATKRADNAAPVVVMKRNHREPLCVMRWADALALLRRADASARAPSPQALSPTAHASSPHTSPHSSPHSSPHASPHALPHASPYASLQAPSRTHAPSSPTAPLSALSSSHALSPACLLAAPAGTAAWLRSVADALSEDV